MRRTFVVGGNRTFTFVRVTESVVASELDEGDGFVEPDTLAELELALASFFPGGGEYQWDEDRLASLFRSNLIDNGTFPTEPAASRE